MAATLTNKDTILQDYFGEGVTNAINTTTQVLNRFPISPKKFDGRVLRENIGYAMPSSGGAYGPSLAAVPSAGTSLNIETYIYHCYIYDTIQIDWDVMEQTSGPHAYIDAVKQEMTRVSEYRALDFERMMLNDGSGYLMPTGFTITVTATAPLAFTITNGAWLAPRFHIGQRIEAWTLRTNAAAKRDTPAQGYYVIGAVSRSGTTLTVTCDSTSNSPGMNSPATGDYIAKDEAIVEDVTPSTTNAGNELQGLASIISASDPPLVTNTKAGFATDSTFQNIDSANSYWQAATTDGTGNYLSIDLAEQCADDIAVHGGMGSENVQFIVANHFQIRKYRASLYPQERYPNSGSAGSFTAGSTSSFKSDVGPMLGDKPTVKSRFCDLDKAYLVGPGIQHYDLKSWGFANKDGSIWRVNQSNGVRPAWMANAYCYKAVGTTKRNCSGVITGLSTT